MITPPSFPTENMSKSVHRSCLNLSCVKHGPNQDFKFRSSCSLRVAVPSPDDETEARERLHKPDTYRVPWRHSRLSKLLCFMFCCEVTSVSVKVIEIQQQKEKNNIEVYFIFHFSGKFAIQHPSSNEYFALKEKIISDFWYRVREGQCSISIALTKLDFNVHAVSACICKQFHGRRKELDYLSQNLKEFKYFFKR